MAVHPERQLRGLPLERLPDLLDRAKRSRRDTFEQLPVEDEANDQSAATSGPLLSEKIAMAWPFLRSSSWSISVKGIARRGNCSILAVEAAMGGG